MQVQIEPETHAALMLAKGWIKLALNDPKWAEMVLQLYLQRVDPAEFIEWMIRYHKALEAKLKEVEDYEDANSGSTGSDRTV